MLLLSAPSTKPWSISQTRFWSGQGGAWRWKVLHQSRPGCLVPLAPSLHLTAGTRRDLSGTAQAAPDRPPWHHHHHPWPFLGCPDWQFDGSCLGSPMAWSGRSVSTCSPCPTAHLCHVQTGPDVSGWRLEGRPPPGPRMSVGRGSLYGVHSLAWPEARTRTAPVK